MSFQTNLPAFFIEKISAIPSNLSCNADLPSSMVSSVVSSFPESDLLEFDPGSELDVEKLIKLLSSKSCVSDPLPTWTLKQYLPVLLPLSLTL